MYNISKGTQKVLIDKLIYGGDGFARTKEGQVVFVEGGVPGDEVVIKSKKMGARMVGEIIEILRPSSHRQKPPCSVFSLCGGCQWQHISIGAQRDWKRRILLETLVRIGKIKIEIENVEETISANDFHYRNNVEWFWDGKNHLGYRKKLSHEVVEFEKCWIMKSAFQAFYDSGVKRESESSLQSRLNFKGEMILIQRDGKGKRIKSNCGHFFENLYNKEFKISDDSFFQVNLDLTEKLFEVLQKRLIAVSGGTLLDLYSGVGTFSLCFSDLFQSVHAVEIAPSSCDDFLYNVKMHDLQGKVFLHQGAAGKILQGELKDDLFDVAIVDPPRAGLEESTLNCLANSVKKKIFYISCNPSTFARDASMLILKGWKLDFVVPFDMFPQTYHIEVLGEFTCAQ